MRSFLASLMVAASVAVLPAMAGAQALSIPGPYGNADGCAYAAGQTVSGDGRFVLHPGGLEAYAALCEFVQVLPARSGAAVVTALCESEGLSDIRMFTISPSDRENGTLLVHFANGELWQEVAACP
ncbi:MAG: hypothetical protein MEQ84_09880 [Mesorhizobium sp.]|nr:hypothetical protein [Mesorhizobium sp.]